MAEKISASSLINANTGHELKLVREDVTLELNGEILTVDVYKEPGTNNVVLAVLKRTKIATLDQVLAIASH